MDKLTQLFSWIMRAWPFLALAAVACCHYVLFKVFASAGNSIDQGVSTFFQVAGGLIVLYSINENIGLFKEKTLYTMMIEWLKDFPFNKKSITAQRIAINVGIGLSGSMTAQTKQKYSSVEEHLSELQRQIDECRQLVHDREKEIRESVEQTKKELLKELNGNNEKIEDVRQLLKETIVGGFKMQLFGVLLVIYGAYVGGM